MASRNIPLNHYRVSQFCFTAEIWMKVRKHNMARHQTSQPRHNIVMRTDQVLTFNRTNSSVAWRCYLFLNMQRRYFIILLGVSEPGWAVLVEAWPQLGLWLVTPMPTLAPDWLLHIGPFSGNTVQRVTPITAEWKYSDASRSNIRF